MPRSSDSRDSSGARLWLGGTLLLGLVALVCLGTAPGVEGFRRLIRVSAHTSLLCFLMAYTAQAAWLSCPQWRAGWVGWQRRHRRHWGWLFVTSHTLHAAAIVALAVSAPALFDALSPLGNRVTGGLAYAFIWAMGATSFDRSAAALGPVWWGRLHTWGSHYIWLSFVVANGKRIAAQPWHVLPILLLLLAFGWRWWAARQHRTQAAVAQG